MTHFKKNTDKKLVFHGNSLFHLGTNNLFYGNAVSNYVRTNLVDKKAVFDYSFQGKNTRQLTTEFQSVVGQYFSLNDVLIHWELINDLVSGQTPAQCLANEIAYYQQAIQKFSKVYILTCIPMTPVFVSNADRLTLNALILAEPTFAGRVIDVTTISEFSTASSYTNTGIYNVDGKHLTTTGYNLVGQKILDTITF